MVARQIASRGIRDPAVLRALSEVPRHRFLDPDLAGEAYEDHPLPIGHGQTISQPYIVAFMAEALALTGAERVLEVGSGCGYMAAVLARLARAVFGLELEPALHARSLETLADLGVANVALRCGDGRLGWPEAAPFDAILLSCAAPAIPPPLWDQLAPGGTLLMPVMAAFGSQVLRRTRKTPKAPETTDLLPVIFVPLR